MNKNIDILRKDNKNQRDIEEIDILDIQITQEGKGTGKGMGKVKYRFRKP